jgi:hypothetical protein
MKVAIKTQGLRARRGIARLLIDQAGIYQGIVATFAVAKCNCVSDLANDLVRGTTCDS